MLRNNILHVYFNTVQEVVYLLAISSGQFEFLQFERMLDKIFSGGTPVVCYLGNKTELYFMVFIAAVFFFSMYRWCYCSLTVKNEILSPVLLKTYFYFYFINSQLHCLHSGKGVIRCMLTAGGRN